MNPEDVFKQLAKSMENTDPKLKAMLNDERLYKLAEYDITQGYTKLKGTDRNTLQSKFTEFKGRVKRGDFTLKEMEDDVYNKWGVTEAMDVTVPEENRIQPIGFKVADIPEDSPENH